MYVSVIIPAYNAESTITYCILSCIIQKGFVREIIVVDDFSTDNTYDVVKNLQAIYPDIIKLYTNPVKGGNNARNFGFTKASGEFIQWLDADDELGSNKLKNQVEFLQREKRFDIAYSNWILKIVDINGDFHFENKVEYECDDFLLKLLNDRWLPPHSYLLRYSSALMICQNCGWNPESIVLQDREYFTIGALLGCKFGFVKNTCVTYYRYTEISSVSKVDSQTRSLALLNLMNRVKTLASYQGLMANIIEDLVNSLIIVSRVQLNMKIPKFKNPGKIHWSVFPGIRIIIKTILKLYLPFY
jgi:glycosyltransferase involved in cell wall biosynthesis